MRKKVKHLFYSLAHPANGFYEIRHEKKGSIFLAFALVLLYGISFSVNRQYASFIVNDVNPLSINSFMEVLSVIALFFLFAIGNWSITCLMEGEGRLVDILTITGYSLLPMVLMYLPCTLLSHIVAEKEEAFYFVLIGASILYFIVLEVIGLMTIHNFTFGKTLVIILLTIVAIFVILFLLLLLVSIVQQIMMFFGGIYDELMLRA